MSNADAQLNAAMRLASYPMWSLVGATAYLGAFANAAGVLDIGLVYPRANETYEPTDDLPLVFTLQNNELAEHLEPSIWFRVLNITNSISDIDVLSEGTHKVRWANASENEPYFLWSHLKVGGEGQVRIIWQPSWSECDESGSEANMARNRTDNFLVDIEVKNGGQKADLIAATAGDSKGCPNQGFAVNVTDKTREVPVGFRGREESGTCAVLTFSSPTPTSNPCRVKVDKAVVESMTAVDLEEKCRGLNPPVECPEQDHAIKKLAIAGAASFAAVLGAALFLA